MTAASPPPDHARRTYDALASSYDLFTAEHDYDRWTADLERLAVAAGLRGTRLLDVACGTGKSLMPFLGRGYDVTGCDISAEMIGEAMAKTAGGARLEVHDMRQLPQLGSFDLICCLDDAVNYLLTPGEVVATLEGMRRNLAPSGVIVFDVNSVRSYRTFYASLTVVPSPDRVVIWDGRAGARFAEGELARVDVELLHRQDDGAWRRRRIDHHHRHHPSPVLQQALATAGLSCAAVYGMQLDGTISAPFAEHGNSKAVYVLRHGER